MSDLFSSLQLGQIRLNNRIVMAPLTRTRATEDGVPTPIMVEYYRQRASAGLIISEATCISPQGVGYMNTPGIWNGEQMAAWSRITQAVHDAGGHIYCQLWHVGRVSHPDNQANGEFPVAPSAIAPVGEIPTRSGMQTMLTPRALDISELPGIVERYRAAAQNALASGFDGVEVHAANGYLLDEFLRDGSNQRTDAYGGSAENRRRLLLEILDAVCGAEGSSRVGVRISPIQPKFGMHDADPQATFTSLVERLNDYGLAYLHVAKMGQETPGDAGPHFDPDSLRAVWKGTYMSNHSYTGASADAAVREKKADLIAFGVPFIANPDLVKRIKIGAPLNTPDVNTFYGSGEHGYTDYPFLPE